MHWLASFCFLKEFFCALQTVKNALAWSHLMFFVLESPGFPLIFAGCGLTVENFGVLARDTPQQDVKWR
ncbi:hypothetical protein D0T21_28855 [Duganella sp. BJB476]|nr:hypothetical protein D0T21_28855 [Duganella sp. BJB476]